MVKPPSNRTRPGKPSPVTDSLDRFKDGETPADRLARAESEEKSRPMRILDLIDRRTKTKNRS